MTNPSRKPAERTLKELLVEIGCASLEEEIVRRAAEVALGIKPGTRLQAYHDILNDAGLEDR